VRAEWQNRPTVDYSCLEAHNLSADRLAADGVSPNDPRVQRVFGLCADEAAKVTVSPVVASHNHDFVVDGLAVMSNPRIFHPEAWTAKSIVFPSISGNARAFLMAIPGLTRLTQL
jgi:hypothetical protein